MTYNQIKSKLLSSLGSISEGQVYLKTTAIPTSYPSATYQYRGFEPSEKMDSRGCKGYLKFSLFILEDVTDYAKQGDIWEPGNEADSMETILKEKLDNLAKVIMADRMIFEGYDTYPGQSDGGRDLLIGRLDLKARGAI